MLKRFWLPASLAALLLAALVGLQQNAGAGWWWEKEPAQPAPADAPVNPDNPLFNPLPTDVVMGDPKAPVLILEYASLSCPHCAHFHEKILPELKKRYIDTGKAKFIFRHFPLNESALAGSLLVNCMKADKYYPLIKALFATQEEWAFQPQFHDSLARIAKVSGINATQFEACLNNKDQEMLILVSRKQAATELKVNSTPTIFINGAKAENAHDLAAVSAMIDADLAGK